MKRTNSTPVPKARMKDARAAGTSSSAEAMARNRRGRAGSGFPRRRPHPADPAQEGGAPLAHAPQPPGRVSPRHVREVGIPRRGERAAALRPRAWVGFHVAVFPCKAGPSCGVLAEAASRAWALKPREHQGAGPPCGPARLARWREGPRVPTTAVLTPQREEVQLLLHLPRRAESFSAHYRICFNKPKGW